MAPGLSLSEPPMYLHSILSPKVKVIIIIIIEQKEQLLLLLKKRSNILFLSDKLTDTSQLSVKSNNNNWALTCS